MTPEQIEKSALLLPGAHKVVQWRGMWVFKVADKMFAVTAPISDGVTLKCQDEDTARLLIEAGVATLPAYLKRGGWVSIAFNAMPYAELEARLTQSYATVRAGLTRLKQAGLPAFKADTGSRVGR
ncbi:MAG: MmcQ/YjbR family DNA-binding protein [Pseudomonadota bacterium]